MRRWLPALAALAILVSGCSSAPSASVDKDKTDFDGLDLEATDTTGLIRGIVVDDRIVPLEGANVKLRTPNGELATTSDAQGRFGFDDLEEGTYFLSATKLNYEDVQTTVEVKAGVEDPVPVRLLLNRLFSQEPFSMTQKFEGFIQCGYQVVGVTSLCLNDYETLVVPDIPPTLKEIFDSRGYVTSLDGGWSTLIFELAWEPSAQGTSPEMFELISFWNRTSSDWYAQCGGQPPSVQCRLEVGVPGPGNDGSGDLIPPEGMGDLYVYGGIQGDPVAFGLSQDFTIYQSNFFYGKPPEGWSFVNGDPDPF